MERELLRRVAVLVRDRMAKWVFEKRTRDFAVETCNIDWMIDRVLADAPPSRSPLVYLNCACGRQKVMRDPDVMYEAGVEEGRRENAAAHARGVAEERERIVKACGALLVRESTDEFTEWDEGFQHAMLTIIEDVCGGSREGLPIVTTMRREVKHGD